MSRTRTLPEECWALVFTFLNQGHYLDTLSLVSKQFLLITNNLVSSLTISDQTLPYLPPLLTRFPMLRSLDIRRFTGDLDMILLQISQSSLSLNSLYICNRRKIPADGFRALGKKMKTLKSLGCGNVTLTIGDLLLISECFPSLEELDISCYKYGYNNATSPVSDIDMKTLSLALPNLRKVKLSGNHLINDSLFFNLCKNCEFLEDIELTRCEIMSQDGIASAIKERPNLTSLSVRNRKSRISSNLIASFLSLKSLTCIDLSFLSISDELLSSVAKASPPLRKLVLQGCSDYGYAGLYCLLSKCPLIHHMDLYHGAEFLEDEHIRELSMFLRNLIHINLSGRYKLTDISFVALVKNCPLLNEIIMEETYLGEIEVLDSLIDPFMDTAIIVNFQVKSLHLSSNKRLRDESIEIFAKICPNLELLDLSSCRGISNGAVEVLKRCPKIRYLSLLYHSKVELFGMINFQFPNLEVLRLSYTEVDDGSLFIISRSCCGLLDLEMANCSQITAEGVKLVVKSCKQLREINLTSCNGVATSVVAWMVSSRPSLRRILAPLIFVLVRARRKSSCVVDALWKYVINEVPDANLKYYMFLRPLS